MLHAIREVMPDEATVYIADLVHFPYGPRPLEEVKGFAFDLIRYLEDLGVKLIVIACNTATAAALSQARERFDVPMVGVVSPGAQSAVQLTATGVIGVVSTEGTMRSQAYLHAIKEVDPMVKVVQRACPELVEIVEAGDADSPRAERALAEDLSGLAASEADTLVLGCTHYPLLRPAIERVFPDRFALVDSAETTAAMVKRRLQHARMLADAGSHPNHLVQVTADPEHFRKVSRVLFGDDVEPVSLVKLWD